MLKLAGLLVLALTELSLGQNTTEDPEVILYDREAAKTSIVTYNKTTTTSEEIAQMEASLKNACMCVVEHLPEIGAFILHDQSSSVRSAGSIRAISGILTVTDDLIITLPDETDSTHTRSLSNDEEAADRDAPNDPLFQNQWALGKLANGADINWQEGRDKYMEDHGGDGGDGTARQASDSSTIVVAVVDTGINYHHLDLEAVMWKNPGEIADNGIDDDSNGIIDDVYGANFGDSNSSYRGIPMDFNGHGTHCAGIIAAATENAQGIAGVAGILGPKVKLMAVKAFGGSGGSTTFSKLLESINYAIRMGAKVSSNSWGGGATQSTLDALGNILNNAKEHLFVAAAGNSNRVIDENYKHLTCSVNAANQICVASSTSQNSKSSFSNTGKSFVHVFAPGSSIFSTYVPRNNSYSYLSGTSMACPQVSGLAAILFSIKPDLSPIGAKMKIMETVQKRAQYSDLVMSGGLIDVFKAIRDVDKMSPQTGLGGHDLPCDVKEEHEKQRSFQDSTIPPKSCLKIAAFFNSKFLSKCGSQDQAENTINAIVVEAKKYFQKYFGSPNVLSLFGTAIDLKVFGKPVYDSSPASNTWQCPVSSLNQKPEDFLLDPTIVSKIDGDRFSDSIHHYTFFTTGPNAEVDGNSCAWVGTSCMKGPNLVQYKTSIHEWNGNSDDSSSQRVNNIKIAGRMFARKLGHALGLKDDFIGFNETTGFKIPRMSSSNAACTNQMGVMDDPSDRPGYPLSPSRWTQCSKDDFHYYMRGRYCLQCQIGDSCEDTLIRCSEFTALCHTEDFRLRLCQKTCGGCCSDYSSESSCNYYRQQGRCTQRSYQFQCKKTCGFCDTCEDYFSNCATSYKDKCDQSYVRNFYCQKTCGACV